MLVTRCRAVNLGHTDLRRCEGRRGTPRVTAFGRGRRATFLPPAESKGCADKAPDADVVELRAVPCYEDQQPHKISAMDPDIHVRRNVAPSNFSSPPKACPCRIASW